MSISYPCRKVPKQVKKGYFIKGCSMAGFIFQKMTSSFNYSMPQSQLYRFSKFQNPRQRTGHIELLGQQSNAHNFCPDKKRALNTLSLRLEPSVAMRNDSKLIPLIRTSLLKCSMYSFYHVTLYSDSASWPN